MRSIAVLTTEKGLMAEMSMKWWDAASDFTEIPNDPTFPFSRTQLRYREGMGVAQLTHVC